MGKAKPQIDFDRIDFPSDSISLKHLRSRNVSLDKDGLSLELMHLREREFAELGFVTALDDAKEVQRVIDRITESYDDPNVPFDEAKFVQKERDFLIDYYAQFGIADGPESARQQVRRLEASGSEQAMRQLGISSR